MHFMVLKSLRSSLSTRINSIAHAGGVNSLENFARSWSRAAGFIEIPSSQPSFVITSEDEERTPSVASPRLPTESRSLLRQQLEQGRSSSEALLVDDCSHHEQHEAALESQEADQATAKAARDVVEWPPHLASSFPSTRGGFYGSLSPRTQSSSMRHAGEPYQQQIHDREEPDKEREPLLVKVVEQEDGAKLVVVVGQSTLPQTVFNSINVLIGVGLLSLPLGLKYSGWLIGLLFLFFAAIVTRYTAGILAKCLDVNPALIGFADVAYEAFGRKARFATGVLFTFELLAACVALVVLFADSLDNLIPGLGVLAWKVLCGIVLVPLSFVPLRYLSFTSVLGIISCIGSKSASGDRVRALTKPQL